MCVNASVGHTHECCQEWCRRVCVTVGIRKKCILFWNILIETLDCHFIILQNELLIGFLSSVPWETCSCEQWKGMMDLLKLV